MIQRIQSVWLFLASFFSGALFILPLYSYFSVPLGKQVLISTRNEYLLLVIAALMTLIPMFTIFLFKNRRRQILLTITGIALSLLFVGMMLIAIKGLDPINTTDGKYTLPGPIIPVLVIVMLFLAFNGIRKDEKLVRSVDRLR